MSLYLPLSAMFFYAVASVIISFNLTNCNPRVLMSIYLPVIWLSTIVSMHVLPVPKEQMNIYASYQSMSVVLMLGVIYFFAETLYVKALSSPDAVPLFVTTGIAASLPVMVGLMSAIWKQVSPTPMQWWGFALVVVGVVMFTKGSR